MLAIGACALVTEGCSSVGKVSKSAYVEGELVGVWHDTYGGKMTLMSDGSVRILDAVCQWRVDYPYLRFTAPSGRVTTFTIIAYDFEAEPSTMTLSGANFQNAKMTRSPK